MNTKTVLRTTLFIFALIVIVVMLIPSFIANSAARKWVFTQLLEPNGIQAEIDSVSVGWFRHTRVRGITIGPKEKEPLLKAVEVLSDRTLLTAMTQGIELGKLTVVSPEIHIVAANGSTNLQFPVPPDLPAELGGRDDESSQANQSLEVEVVNAQLFVKTASMEQESQVFQGANLSCTLYRQSDHRTLSVEGGRIIDHAQLSPELCAGGLKYILPILSEATWTKGEFSIELDACVVDLDDPQQSLVSGRLLVHGVEAGIRNELVAAASKSVASLFGRQDFESVVFADESVVNFQIRDGLVWHDGVEFGLPKVSKDLVVTTSGTVTFDETLDLTIDVPMPLHLIANGPIAQALTDKQLTLNASGTLSAPKISINDDDFVANMVSSIGQQLADEERPIQSIFEGFRDAIRGSDEAASDTSEGTFIERLRERRGRREGGGFLRNLISPDGQAP